MSTAVHITWHGAQINFGDLPTYLTYEYALFRGIPSWSDHLCSHTTSNQPCTVKVPHTAKTQYRNLETKIPRKGTAWLQSQFMFLWAIYVFLWPVCLFCCRKIGGSKVGIQYLDRSQTLGNWDCGRALFLEYINSHFYAVQFQMSGEASCTCSSLVWTREFCCWENTIIDDFKRAGKIPREVRKSSSGELEYT